MIGPHRQNALDLAAIDDVWSGDHFFDHSAVDVGEAVIAPLGPEGQAGVLDAEQVAVQGKLVAVWRQV